MNIRICTKCKKELELENNFSIKNKKKNWYQCWCKSCSKIYKNQHYLNNKETYLKKARKADDLFRIKWRKFKKTLKCEKCGENDQACLDFHHLNKKDKEYSIAQMVIRRMSMNKIKKEIQKCIVLCSNCHRKEHYTY